MKVGDAVEIAYNIPGKPGVRAINEGEEGVIESVFRNGFYQVKMDKDGELHLIASWELAYPPNEAGKETL